ncbi:four-carbon acid sugar kinase family protein [Glaciibacter superstes]|uniref:four-carbon acid sugar kinase family protein n=1 Tax=Glaciibacter superstes TaxID=501023 RepID=UPI0003B408B9|nr:four-carbon acid sugar kinase family protein [Glaciibacter superstes]
MSELRPSWATAPTASTAPAASEALSLDELLAGVPPVRETAVTEVALAARAGRRVIVLDDDPTGTQTVADVPVLTAWTPENLRWALQQDAPGFFVLTNSRSLSEESARALTAQVAEACIAAAAQEGAEIVFASRSDSTLRGHFPLETDVISEVLARHGQPVDGIILVPAYVDAGRVTIGGEHWVRTNEGMRHAADTEFARDATFGYRSSSLPEWVAEKSSGRIPAADVKLLTLDVIRSGGADAVRELLEQVHGGRVVAVDSATDDDLRIVSLAVLEAERQGRRFLYRIGPSFVRARLGQAATPAIQGERLRAILEAGVGANGRTNDDGSRAVGGLVVVGSHTALTTRQLERLRVTTPALALELDVTQAADPQRVKEAVTALADQVFDELGHGLVIVSTSRILVTGADGEASLALSRRVSAALIDLVRDVRSRIRPAFVVAKGGITSSDVATGGLGIVRSWARGTMLPGIVSLWQPVGGSADGIPYVVFAGNVGDDDSLAQVIGALQSSSLLPGKAS